MSSGFEFPGGASPVDPQDGHPGEVFAAAGHAEPPPPVGSEAPVRDEPAARPEAGVSRGAFLALVAYASLVTAACLGLAYLLWMNRADQLESLPDVVPPQSKGEVSRVLAPPDAVLPPGHTLALGEARRFGDLLVTPVKVTREPLSFTHYRGAGTREPAGEVLKLWLKFENVGAHGRAFAPLDAELLFYRATDRAGGLRANNFLAAAGDRSRDHLIPVYDQPAGSDWDLAGQELGKVLKPGESVVMYVPTVTELPDLGGSLVWRVQVRKGVAANGWGVTTLVEVAFGAGEVGKS